MALTQSVYSIARRSESNDKSSSSVETGAVLNMLRRQFAAAAVRCCFAAVILVTHQLAISGGDVSDDVSNDDVTGNPLNPARPGSCPQCQPDEVLHQLPHADIVRLHVERIKREILRKLGLAAPPNVTGRRLPGVHFLPPPLRSTSEPSSLRDVAGEDRVFPDDGVDYLRTMSDSSSPHQAHQGSDEYFSDGDLEEEGAEEGFEEEFDYDVDELNLPALPPRSKQVIIFSEQFDQCGQRVGADCYKFRLTGFGDNVDVTSAHLWVYKTRDVIGHHFADSLAARTAPNQTITVRQVASTSAPHGTSGGESVESGSSSRPPKTLASVTVRRRSGCWVRTDVHQAVLEQMRRRPRRWQRELNVSVECRGGCVLARGRPSAVGGDDRRPVLVVGTAETRRHRRRRMLGWTTCPRSRCCLHRLYIDFAQVGWNFVRQPRGYEINYCHGPCTFRPWENAATRGYVGMLMYLGRQRGLREALPCCSATATADISLLYINDDATYIKQDIPNMRVLECGCA